MTLVEFGIMANLELEKATVLAKKTQTLTSKGLINGGMVTLTKKP